MHTSLMPIPPPTTKSGHVTSEPAASALMADYRITFNGRHFVYERFRYERLADAVDYARLQQRGSPGTNDASPMPAPEVVEVPDEMQRQQMSAWSITYGDGYYRLGPFRYERLADAVAYASLKPQSER